MTKYGAIALIGVVLTVASCQAYETKKYQETQRAITIEYIKNGYVYKSVGNHWYFDKEWIKEKSNE